MNKNLQISIVIIVGVGVISGVYYLFFFQPKQKATDTQTARQAEYRSECAKEIDDKFTMVDNLVLSSKNITTEAAQAIARSAGITDENNYVKDKDALIKECADKKEHIYLGN